MILQLGIPNPVAVSVLTDRAAGHGGIVWDASLVLADYLTGDTSSITRGARVLEIGAGAGLPSLAAALAHRCRCIVTDKPALLGLIEANIAVNRLGAAATASNSDHADGEKEGLAGHKRKHDDGARCSSSSIEHPLHAPDKSIDASGSCVAAALQFGGSLKRLTPKAARPPYDVILASDVLGCADAGAFDGILKTLRDCFAANPDAAVLMSYRQRAGWEKEFFRSVQEDEGWCLRCVETYSPRAIRELKARAVMGWHADAGEVEGSVEGLMEVGCWDDNDDEEEESSAQLQSAYERERSEVNASGSSAGGAVASAVSTSISSADAHDHRQEGAAAPNTTMPSQHAQRGASEAAGTVQIFEIRATASAQHHGSSELAPPRQRNRRIDETLDSDSFSRQSAQQNACAFAHITFVDLITDLVCLGGS